MLGSLNILGINDLLKVHCHSIQEDLLRNPLSVDTSALEWLTRMGFTDSVIELLGRHWIWSQRQLDSVVLNASQSGNLNLVKYMLEEDGSVEAVCDEDEWGPLITASLGGQTAVVEYLLTFEGDLGFNDALVHATRKGHFGCVELLLQDSRTDTSVKALNDTIVHVSCESLETVKHLLSHPNADRLQNYSQVLQRSANSGAMDTFKYILKVHGHDFTARDLTCALGAAIQGNQVEIAKFLLADSRVDPSDDDNAAIRDACAMGSLDLAKTLLLDNRVDPSARNNEAIQANWRFHENNSAVGMEEEAQIVQLLLKDSRVDPTANDSAALRNATARQNIESVKLLLADGRVDATFSIELAVENGWLEFVKLLMRDGQSYKGDKGCLLKLASMRKNKDVLAYLLEDSEFSSVEDFTGYGYASGDSA
ncbi:UNVERIFIED_CONTAM: hypothetical protein HDU68_006111 [Siphonaria sp. JEL0065]|nr:hypothetical protein HDU68_006111 [Siphonaria sp. JEL0065]